MSREAAEQVAGASLLLISSLVDKSLLRKRSDGRYEMHQLLRQYGEARLSERSDEAAAAHERHCAYYAQFVSRYDAQLHGAGLTEAITAIGAEIEHIRAAWQWAIAHRNADALGILYVIWYKRIWFPATGWKSW